MANQDLFSRAHRDRADGFFQSYGWPVATILAYVCISLAAFTPRLIDFVMAGYWGKAVTDTFEIAPAALNIHALFGMALIPFFFAQPILGAVAMQRAGAEMLWSKHRRLGRVLTLAASSLSLLGLYITYIVAVNSGSMTAVIFIFLVALFVTLYFAQAVWDARKGRIARHLDAVVCAMIFLSLPAAGRLVEAVMRGFGVENTRSREVVSIGFGYQIELVDITVTLISSMPLLLWAIFAIPRGVLLTHPAKLGTVIAFLVFPLGAIVAQAVAR